MNNLPMAKEECLQALNIGPETTRNDKIAELRRKLGIRRHKDPKPNYSDIKERRDAKVAREQAKQDKVVISSEEYEFCESECGNAVQAGCKSRSAKTRERKKRCKQLRRENAMADVGVSICEKDLGLPVPHYDMLKLPTLNQASSLLDLRTKTISHANECNELQKLLQSATEESMALNTERTGIQSRVHELSKKVKMTTSSTTSKEISACEKEIQEKSKQLQLLSNENANLTANIEQLRTEQATILTENLFQAKAELDNARQQLAEKVTELDFEICQRKNKVSSRDNLHAEILNIQQQYGICPEQTDMENLQCVQYKCRSNVSTAAEAVNAELIRANHEYSVVAHLWSEIELMSPFQIAKYLSDHNQIRKQFVPLIRP